MKHAPETHTLTVAEVARLVGGTVSGNSNAVVQGLCPLDSPLPACITFSRTHDAAHIRKLLKGTEVSAVLVPPVTDREALVPPPTFIVVPDPMAALFSLVPRFYTSPPALVGISPLASIDPTAILGAGVAVGPFCVVGPQVTIGAGTVLHANTVLYAHAKIGARSVLHANVVVREHCEIGDDCIIHSGAVIGADGFGYVPGERGMLEKVPQIGIVRLGAHVEIGANACIDRATLGITEVGAGSKLDNLVQVGHNVRIGKSSMLCGQVGVAGSVVIGDGVVLGGQTGVKNHVAIASGARVGARSGVSSDIQAGDYAGYPAIPAAEWRRQVGAIARLPRILKKLKRFLQLEEE